MALVRKDVATAVWWVVQFTSFAPSVWGLTITTWTVHVTHYMVQISLVLLQVLGRADNSQSFSLAPWRWHLALGTQHSALAALYTLLKAIEKSSRAMIFAMEGVLAWYGFLLPFSAIVLEPRKIGTHNPCLTSFCRQTPLKYGMEQLPIKPNV